MMHQPQLKRLILVLISSQRPPLKRLELVQQPILQIHKFIGILIVAPSCLTIITLIG
jgi:hypothetical protein